MDRLRAAGCGGEGGSGVRNLLIGFAFVFAGAVLVAYGIAGILHLAFGWFS